LPAIPEKQAVNTHFDSSCPHCQRALRIRNKYLGMRIACNYCNHTFVAKAPAAAAPSTPPAPAAPPASGGAADATGQQVARLEAELRQARGELATRTAE
jgi:hypothetical protein